MLQQALQGEQSVALSLAQFDLNFINTLAQVQQQQGELDFQADSWLREATFKIVAIGFGAGKPGLVWE